MNILCLHGFRTSKDHFEKSINKKIVSKLKNHKFYFINSLFSHKEEGYQWWNTTKEGLYNLEKYDTIDESIEYIIKFIKENKIDILWGFSQGGCIANIIAHKYPKLLKKVIISSGFPTTDLNLINTVNHKIELDCLITYGEKDDLVIPSLTKKLVDDYKKVVLYEHKWGHVIPNDNKFMEVLLEFLK
jgi:predicted esterase